MADGKTFEYGNAASEVQFQDEIGKLKNRQGEAVIEVNDDQEFFLATSGDSVKIKTLIDDDAFNTGVTDTALATAESIKAYVDAAAGGGSGSFTDVTVDTNTLVANITGYTDKVGVATATPRRTLDVLDASNPQLRLTHTDDTEYLDVQSLSTGDAVMKMTDGIMHLRSGGTYAYLQIQNTTTGQSDGSTDGFTVGANGVAGYLLMRDASSTLSLGVGGVVGITLDATRNATFVANLSADGNVTLGDASGDTHTVNGTLRTRFPLTTVTATAAIPATDNNSIVHVNNTSGAIAVLTLPAIASCPAGTWFQIKDASFTAGTYEVQVATPGAATIDNNATLTPAINQDGGAIQIYSDGTNWFLSP